MMLSKAHDYSSPPRFPLRVAPAPEGALRLRAGRAGPAAPCLKRPERELEEGPAACEVREGGG